MFNSKEEPLAIRHNEEAQRFEAVIDGELCRADYRLTGDVMAMHHTEVPPAVRGQGVAAALVHAALDYARRTGLRVAPYCAFVQAYVRKHPETHDLLA